MPKPKRLREAAEGTVPAPLFVAVGRCLFGVETLNLSSVRVLLLFARAPHRNYTTEQKQVVRAFLESGGAVGVFLCECNFDCMGDLLVSYGVKLHRLSANASLIGAVPQIRRFDIEGSADETIEKIQEGWTTLVETDSVRPRTVVSCRRVGKGLLVCAPQKMFGRELNRSRNVDFWRTVLTSAAYAGERPVKGPIADQSADDAPVQVCVGQTLICAPLSLEHEVQVWAERIPFRTKGEERILLCDSACQDQELCGKRKFRHLGAFRKNQTDR